MLRNCSSGGSLRGLVLPRFLDRKKKKAEAKAEAEAETKAKAEAAQAAAVTAIAPAEQRIVKTRYTATALLRVCRRRSC